MLVLLRHRNIDTVLKTFIDDKMEYKKKEKQTHILKVVKYYSLVAYAQIIIENHETSKIVVFVFFLDTKHIYPKTTVFLNGLLLISFSVEV